MQYADDTQFIHSDSIDNLNELMRRTEETLNKIISYFNKNGLLLNTKKTQCMFIGSRALLSRISSNNIMHVNDTQIKPSDSVKNLGVYFDKYMLFEEWRS